jgi:hypothetical protein
VSRLLRFEDSLRSPHDPMERDATDAATSCYKSGIVLFKGCPTSATNAAIYHVHISLLIIRILNYVNPINVIKIG